MSRMVDRLASALGAPLRAARLMTRGERQLAEVRGLARSAKKATDDLASDTRHIGTRIDGRLDKHAARLAAVQQDVCLLYTSDAADERSSVDLGGRRIIK